MRLEDVPAEDHPVEDHPVEDHPAEDHPVEDQTSMGLIFQEIGFSGTGSNRLALLSADSRLLIAICFLIKGG